MERVLAPGGRLALNAWGRWTDSILCRAGGWDHRGVLGEEAAKSAFNLPFSLNTAAELRMLASDAGLRRISIRFEQPTMRYPAPAKMVAAS